MKDLRGAWTVSYYLTATDLKRNQAGGIEARDTQIYLKLYWRSLRIALLIRTTSWMALLQTNVINSPHCNLLG